METLALLLEAEGAAADTSCWEETKIEELVVAAAAVPAAATTAIC